MIRAGYRGSRARERRGEVQSHQVAVRQRRQRSYSPLGDTLHLAPHAGASAERSPMRSPTDVDRPAALARTISRRGFLTLAGGGSLVLLAACQGSSGPPAAPAATQVPLAIKTQ